MTPPFSVRTTASFDRSLRKLAHHHPDLPKHYARVLLLLSADPYDRARAGPIRKLASVAVGDGQYRIRSGRFRFRYDILGEIVYLKACSLRREDTYRR
jgi:mRNA-degrading endonuclease RelE of RelBE toxin-antitoxin system